MSTSPLPMMSSDFTPRTIAQQLISFTALRESSSTTHAFLLMILLFIIDGLFKFLPPILTKLYERFQEGMRRRIDLQQLTGAAEPAANEVSIEFVRNYGQITSSTSSSNNSSSSSNLVDTDEVVDAIIDIICNHESMDKLLYQKRFYIYSKQPLQVTSHIWAQMISIEESNGAIGSVRFRLYSTSITVKEIRQWINRTYKNYMLEKMNKIGSTRYYFQEYVVEPMMDIDGSYRWDTAPRHMHFTMTEFKTSKSLTNVYGDHIQELKDRVDLFVNHPEWYEERGIPYTLGIMGYGDPGCGKTSIAKALAKSLDVHIVSLSLRPTTTQRQLMNLFYDERIHVMGADGDLQVYTIPLNKRLYIIEDIDCLTDIVLDREYRQQTQSAAAEPIDEKKQKLSLAAAANNQITLSFLLNLLDGVLETPGRIMMITTNFPEKLDRALTRPGRIDVKVHFTRCNKKMISDIMSNFYQIDKATVFDRLSDRLDGVWTPAEVIAIFSQHYNNPEAAYSALMDNPILTIE